MKSRLLILTVTLSISLMFSVHGIYAQESIDAWNLTMENSYEITINTENLILDYIRAETNNNKILMYVEIENPTENGSIEFTFPIKAVDEIFNDSACAFDATQESSEFLVYVNQNMQDIINSDVTDDDIILSIMLPPDSGVVEIFSLCNSVIESEKEQNTVSTSSSSSKHTVREVPLSIQTPNDVNLIISGTLEEYQDGQNVSIMIKNDRNEPILVSQLIPNPAGYFSLNVTRQGILWDDAKSFTVKAFVTNIDDKAIPIGLMKPNSTKIISPLKQTNLGFEQSNVICNSDLLLIQKHDGSPACVEEQSISKLVERNWGTSDNWIKISNAKRALNYEFDAGKITVIDAFSEYKNPSLPGETKDTSLEIKMDSEHAGILKIVLPRDLIDSKTNTLDENFFILLDGIESEYQETKTGSERTLSIHIPAKTNEMTIIGYGYYNYELNSLDSIDPELKLSKKSFEEIKNDIEKTEYGICGIEIKQNKIIIHLNWIFEGSEQEHEIISKIPDDINYQIIYYDDYVDFSPQTLREPHCEVLRRDHNQDGQIVSFPFCGEDGFDSQGNLKTDNSTHHWDGNYCEWKKIENEK